MTLSRISALTLDLDDTLWPVWPALERAERRLHDWLSENAVATAAAFDVAGLRRVRDEVALQRPDWSHDLTAIRQESLRRALQACGDDPALALPAFDVFFAARHEVDLYPDALDALERLAGRFPLFALTNGNADIQRVGLAHLFKGSLSARQFGFGKPDPRIFTQACLHLGIEPAAVLHAGDDLVLDVSGALGAGLQAAWIRREDGLSRSAEPPAGVHTFSDLHALAERLGC
jgi:HAD superfamily hydrolase (TIGR01549 family)